MTHFIDTRTSGDLHSGRLGSTFAVTEFAHRTITEATLSAARLWAARLEQDPGPVIVDPWHASMSFAGERLLQPIGWQLPPVWDPLSGDYRCADGWIRLHTNYDHHRRAVVSVMDGRTEPDQVRAAVERWDGDDLEAAVVAAGGCAAVMRAEAQWRSLPAGRAVAAESAVAISGPKDAGTAGEPPAWAARAAERPLAGVRVVDLTRVMAGPGCTRFLAAWGATVTRVDPPGFAEVPAVVPETTAGKHLMGLDLHDGDDRRRFEELVAGADVIVHGYRSGAMRRLGYDDEALWALRPGLVIGALDAYGFTGPWADRRGFDSLVQMSTGIAQAAMEATGASRPVPLPVQALDHGAGYLLAAAVIDALCRQLDTAAPSAVRISLARTALDLMAMGRRDPGVGEPVPTDLSDVAPMMIEAADSLGGPVRRVRLAGSIGSATPRLAPPVSGPGW